MIKTAEKPKTKPKKAANKKEALNQAIEETYGVTKDGLCDVARMTKGYQMISDAMEGGDENLALKVASAIKKLEDNAQKKEKKLEKVLEKSGDWRNIHGIRSNYNCRCQGCRKMTDKHIFRESYWRFFGGDALAAYQKNEARVLFQIALELVKSMSNYSDNLEEGELPEWEIMMGE